MRSTQASPFTKVIQLGAIFSLCLLWLFVTSQQPASAQGLSSSARNHCGKKNVLFIMDRSGSMKENNKFDDARQIIHNTVARYDSQVRFGFETFSTTPSIDEPLPTPAANIQKTLRNVKNEGSTEMVKAVNLAAKHLTSVLLTDTVPNRPTYVILVTDGKPNPPPCPVKEVAALRSLVVGPAKYDIKTYVVGFGDQVDAKCLNDLAAAGGTALPRANFQYILASNSNELSDAMNEIVGRTASEETCNDQDDDCDGYVDNRKGTRQDYTLVQNCRTACGTGTQLCVRGQWGTCSVNSPRNEVCNGKDDDCNGQVDDGATCPDGGVCFRGQCYRSCRGNECPRGQTCIQKVCVPTDGGTNPGNPGNNNNNGNSNHDKGGGSNGNGNNNNPKIACQCSASQLPTQSIAFYLWMLLFLLPVGIRLSKRSR